MNLVPPIVSAALAKGPADGRQSFELMARLAIPPLLLRVVEGATTTIKRQVLRESNDALARQIERVEKRLSEAALERAANSPPSQPCSQGENLDDDFVRRLRAKLDALEAVEHFRAGRPR